MKHYDLLDGNTYGCAPAGNRKSVLLQVTECTEAPGAQARVRLTVPEAFELSAALDRGHRVRQHLPTFIGMQGKLQRGRACIDRQNGHGCAP